jgi:valyl-tRNA synthetase
MHTLPSDRDLIETIQLPEEMDCITQEWYNLLNQDRFSQCARSIQSHFRHYFCDTWIEENKRSLWDGNKETSLLGQALLKRYLTLFNPFIPFMTTYIDQNMFD